MKIVICGAGITGSSIARYLSEDGNEVVVIDRNESLLSDLKNNLDIKTILGHASYPSVLKQAGLDNTDVLIAVTGEDELNLIVCRIAESLADIPVKIARIKTKEYRTDDLHDLFHVDVLISPDDEIAESILRTLTVSQALNVLSLNNGKLCFLGMKLKPASAIEGMLLNNLEELYPTSFVKILAVIREGEPVILSEDTQLLPNDDVYFIAQSDKLTETLELFGQPPATQMKNILIFGGGRVGSSLASLAEKQKRPFHVTIIEKNKKRAYQLAEQLPKSLILEGDALDGELLKEGGIQSSDAALALTGDDEDNILLSLLAKKNNVPRTFALLNKRSYDSFVHELGIDAIIDAEAVTVSTILRHVRQKQAYTLPSDLGELWEVRVKGPVESEKLQDCVLCAVIRYGKAGHTDEIKSGDTLIVYHPAEQLEKRG